MTDKKKAAKPGRLPEGSVTGLVDAVSTGLNASRSEARRALVRFGRRLRK